MDKTWQLREHFNRNMELKIRRWSVEEDIERRWKGMKTGTGGTQEGNWNQEESVKVHDFHLL